MEDAILALERRGINLRTHANRINLESGKLPVFHVFVGTEEYWFVDRKEMDDFIKSQERKAGEELTSRNQRGRSRVLTPTENRPIRVRINEFHEVKTINAGLKELESFGFDIESLLPKERTGIEEAALHPPPRRDTKPGVDDLRGLVRRRPRRR